MAILKEIDVDLDEFDITDLVTFLKHEKGYKVIKPKSVIDSAKLEHFLEVYQDYSLEKIEDILPRK